MNVLEPLFELLELLELSLELLLELLFEVLADDNDDREFVEVTVDTVLLINDSRAGWD
jgi:hypothetical protein